MEELAQRLQALGPTIEEIMRLSGCPGASIGISHQKETILKQGYGFRDIGKRLQPDEHTTYYLASLSKSFTAALIGMLVEDDKLKWTDPVMPLLRGATHWDTVIREQSTIVDWMSHRTGLAPKNLVWSQEFGYLSMQRQDTLPTISYLEKVFYFRSHWLYSNWGYAIAAEVVTRLSGKSWGAMLKERIFDPLGMSRTVTKQDPSMDNVAEPYTALRDGTSYHLPQPSPEDGTVMQGAVAVRSNVNDLLNYYAATMFAVEDQKKNETSSTDGNPIVQASMLFQPHVALDAGCADSDEERSDQVQDCTGPETSYGLGWITTQLPARLGNVGMNSEYTSRMPVVGKGLNKRTQCVYHHGSNNTSLTSVHLLPESNTAIVVLTNSMGNNDTADWLGQLLLQTVLDVPVQHQHDYIALARESARRSSQLWCDMAEDLERGKMPETHPRELQQYAGIYTNVVKTYCIEVLAQNGNLMMCYQSHHEQLYHLKHHRQDVFSWLLTRDESVRRGRFPITFSEFYLFYFVASECGGEIDGLRWCNDSNVPGGELFQREVDYIMVENEEDIPPECTG